MNKTARSMRKRTGAVAPNASGLSGPMRLGRENTGRDAAGTPATPAEARSQNSEARSPTSLFALRTSDFKEPLPHAPRKSGKLSDLLKLFDGLHGLYEQLLGLIQSKIDAMRRADVETMRQLAEQEHAVVTRLHEREGLCRQLMDAVGEDVGLPRRTGRSLPLSQLASRLPAPERAGLLHAAEGLRDAIFKAARANRIVGVVSRELLNHMKWILGSVRPAGTTPVGYSGDGALVAPSYMRIFETVG